MGSEGGVVIVALESGRAVAGRVPELGETGVHIHVRLAMASLQQGRKRQVPAQVDEQVGPAGNLQ